MERKLSPAEIKGIQSGKIDDPELIRLYGLMQLEGLPSTADYLAESRHTIEWVCPNCEGGAKIPCAIDCPSCGQKRPPGNWDPEQGEGKILGFFRQKAKRRR